MRNRFKLLILVLVPLALALRPSPANAALSQLIVSGSSSDGPLAATATFSTSTGQIVITLANDLSASSIGSAGQAISDVQFTLGNTSGTVAYSATGSSVTGQLANVSSSNVATYTGGEPLRWLGQGPPPPNGSGTVPSVNGSTIVVTVESLGGGSPTQMIAPSIANGGTFTSANSGFANFSPYVVGTETITLSLSGVTADTTVTSATLSFGTGPDHFLSGTPKPVPEPSTFVGAATAVLFGLGYGWRRRLRTA